MHRVTKSVNELVRFYRMASVCGLCQIFFFVRVCERTKNEKETSHFIALNVPRI